MVSLKAMDVETDDWFLCLQYESVTSSVLEEFTEEAKEIAIEHGYSLDFYVNIEEYKSLKLDK